MLDWIMQAYYNAPPRGSGMSPAHEDQRRAAGADLESAERIPYLAVLAVALAVLVVIRAGGGPRAQGARYESRFDPTRSLS